MKNQVLAFPNCASRLSARLSWILSAGERCESLPIIEKYLSFYQNNPRHPHTWFPPLSPCQNSAGPLQTTSPGGWCSKVRRFLWLFEIKKYFYLIFFYFFIVPTKICRSEGSYFELKAGSVSSGSDLQIKTFFIRKKSGPLSEVKSNLP